jgi:DNA topoisomerase-1
MTIIYRNKINEERKIYQYVDKNNKIVQDKKILEYINSMAPIPPAYNDVRIYYEKNPKILFDGRDIKGKLQQIYSTKFRLAADKNKFKSLIEFGYKLPEINKQIEKNINGALTPEKVISLILVLIQDCGFRIGSLTYFKLNKSIGLSTLMRKHLTFKKDKTIQIKFLGKKGVENNCIVKNPVITRELTKLASTKKPNDFMFSYIDNSNQEMLLSGDNINNWLKTYGDDFTTKMFRTFSTNVLFIDLMHETKPQTLTENERKKKVKQNLEILSTCINNSPTICKKSYLSSDLLKLYIEHGKKYETDINKSSGTFMQKFIMFLEKIH